MWRLYVYIKDTFDLVRYKRAPAKKKKLKSVYKYTSKHLHGDYARVDDGRKIMKETRKKLGIPIDSTYRREEAEMNE